MEDFNINITAQNPNPSYYDRNIPYYNPRAKFIMKVVMWIIPSIGLPLTLVAIYALYSQVRNNRVAPIYIINLLISDLIQLCCMMVMMAQKAMSVCDFIYWFTLIASVGFMVCIALERYLVIACPVWYRFRRTIKTSVVVCVVVWAFSLIFAPIFFFLLHFKAVRFLSGAFLLLPLPLFIFFLGGTIKALSSSRVPSDEKRRIVGILVLVLLIYTLLFLPSVILFLAQGDLIYNNTFRILCTAVVFLSPLADLVLYVFMRKGIIDKLLASVCCCRMDSDDIGTYE